MFLPAAWGRLFDWDKIEMGLAATSPSIEIEFHESFPQTILSTMLLLRAVHRFEGMSEWTIEVAKGLSPVLTRNLEKLDLVMAYCLGSWVDLVGHYKLFSLSDFDALMEHLRTLPTGAYRAAARRGLDRLLVEWALAPANSAVEAEPDWIASLLALVWGERQAHMGEQADETLTDAQKLLDYFSQPNLLRELVLTTLEGFWESLPREEFYQDSARVRQAVSFYREKSHPKDFRSAFKAITGRTIPSRLNKRLKSVRTVIMMPMCHLGPYLVVLPYGDRMYVSFNASMALIQSCKDSNIAILYPPLKALADETRLQIVHLLCDGELYVDEIADRLGISHSSASRHLSLLATASILDTRKENRLRFFRLNVPYLHSLTSNLQEFFRL